MKMNLVVSFLVALISLCHQPIWAGGSRVGNGGGSGMIVDPTGAYEFEVPLQFQPQKKLQDGVRLKGPATMIQNSGGGPFGIPQFKEQTVDVLSFEKEIPALKDFSKDRLEKWLDENKYKARSIESRCVLARSVKREGLSTTIVAWGKGQGITISADEAPAIDENIDQILKTLKIQKGECSWK